MSIYLVYTVLYTYIYYIKEGYVMLTVMSQTESNLGRFGSSGAVEKQGSPRAVQGSGATSLVSTGCIGGWHHMEKSQQDLLKHHRKTSTNKQMMPTNDLHILYIYIKTNEACLN